MINKKNPQMGTTALHNLRCGKGNHVGVVKICSSAFGMRNFYIAHGIIAGPAPPLGPTW